MLSDPEGVPIMRIPGKNQRMTSVLCIGCAIFWVVTNKIFIDYFWRYRIFCKFDIRLACPSSSPRDITLPLYVYQSSGDEIGNTTISDSISTVHLSGSMLSGMIWSGIGVTLWSNMWYRCHLVVASSWKETGNFTKSFASVWQFPDWVHWLSVILDDNDDNNE